MRILIVGINYSPELTGIGKYTGEMAEYLARKEHEIHVVTAPPYYPQWKVSKPYKSGRYQREKNSGITVYRCPLWVPRKQTGFKRVLHLCSFALSSFPVITMQYKWKPDLIINIAPSLFSALAVLFSAKISHAKTWLHIQDFELDAAFNLGLINGKAWLQKIAVRFESNLINRFDKVSTISQRMIERLLQKGLSSEKTVLFPNWIDTDLIKPLKQPIKLREEWGISEEKIIVLYSGNMGRKQGLELIIDAARILAGSPEIEFVLCGDGSERAHLIEQAASLPNIHFYSLQPLDRLNELLNLADIHVLPQLKDATDLVMPSKLSGMLASGKAIVATASPSSELGKIINEIGVISEPGNSAQLAEKLLALSNDANKRMFLGDKGRCWVELNWEKEKVLEEFENRLRNMLES